MIGTGAAILGGALVGGVASITGGRQAGRATDRASRRATDAELQMFNQSRRDLAPWRESGEGALSILNQIYGISTPGTNGTPRKYSPDELVLSSNGVPMVNAELYASDPVYRQAWDQTLAAERAGPQWRNQGAQTYYARATDADFGRLQQSLASNIVKAQGAQPSAAAPVDRTGGFTTSPGYRFRVDEDTRAIERSAAARGRLFSGGTRDAIGERASARASEEWNNFLAGLRAQAGLGQAATSQGANLASQTGGALANIYQNQGAQRASSYQQMAGGVNSAIQGGLGNWVFYDMMRNPKPRPVG